MKTSEWMELLRKALGANTESLQKQTPRKIEALIEAKGGPLGWEERTVRGGMLNEAVDSLTEDEEEDLHRETEKFFRKILARQPR